MVLNDKTQKVAVYANESTKISVDVERPRVKLK